MISKQTYNDMKKISLSIILAIVTILIFIIPSYAKEELRLEKISTTSAQVERVQLKNPIAKDEVMENLRKRANIEIVRRITSLTELIVKINGLKKLSQVNKAGLVIKVQEEITSLNKLKITIDADMDIITLRADVKSIVQSYRIYAFFIPQIRILISADNIGQSANNLTDLATKLESLIDKSGATEATLTSLRNYLSDMRVKIQEANDAYQAVQIEVLALTPAGYPANKAILENVRIKLQTGTKALKVARDDAKQIVRVLRSF